MPRHLDSPPIGDPRSGAPHASTMPARATAPAGAAGATPEVAEPERGPADSAVPYLLQVTAGIAWRVIVVAIALWGLGQAMAATRTVGIPVAVGLLLTALAMPGMVLLNHRLGLGRHLAAAITTLGGVAVVVGLLTLAGNQLVSGFSDLRGQIVAAVVQIQEWLASGPFQLGSEQINEAITSGEEWVSQNSSSLTSGAVSAGTTATEFLVGTIIALIVMFFFLAEGDSIWAWFVRLLPRAVREPVHQGFRRGWVSLGSYVKTQMLVAFIDAFFIALGALILGLPLVIPLGLIIFFASAVPIVGAVVSGALAVLLALVVKGPVYALIMLGIVLAVQQIESHILQPLLMGRAVSLHPLAVLLGVAVFSFLFGIVGALFAVPVMAVTNTVILYWTGHDKFPMLDEGHSAISEPPKKLVAERPTPSEQHPEVGSVSPIDLEKQATANDRADTAAAAGSAQDHQADEARDERG